MSETQMLWDEIRCRADPMGAAAEIRRLSEKKTPMRFHPQAMADLEHIAESDPEGAKELGELLTGMREAAQAWRAGKFASFEDAMEALTGQRPEPVTFDEGDASDLDGDFIVGQPHFSIRRNDQGHAEAIERNGLDVLLLVTGAERNEQEVEDVVARLNRNG